MHVRTYSEAKEANIMRAYSSLHSAVLGVRSRLPLLIDYER